MDAKRQPTSGTAGEVSVRNTIIANAQRVFLEYGYEAARMREIVKASGYSKPTLYFHFNSKEQLFEALVTSICEQISLPDISIHNDMAAVEVFEELVEAYRKTVLNSDFIELYRLVIAEAKRFPELGRIFYASGPQASRQALAEIFAQLSERKLLAEISNPLIAAEQFEALILEPVKIRTFLLTEQNHSEAEFNTFVSAAIELFLKAYGVAK